MAFKVQVGPPQIAIHQGQTVLVTDPDGTIVRPSEKGLYFLDTRIISNWAIYANGEPWQLLNGGPINYYAARIFLTNTSILTEWSEQEQRFAPRGPVVARGRPQNVQDCRARGSYSRVCRQRELKDRTG